MVIGDLKSERARKCSQDAVCAQLCLTLRPTDCHPPGSSVQAVLQAEYWKIPPPVFPSKGSNPHVCVSLHCRWILHMPQALLGSPIGCCWVTITRHKATGMGEIPFYESVDAPIFQEVKTQRHWEQSDTHIMQTVNAIVGFLDPSQNLPQLLYSSIPI